MNRTRILIATAAVAMAAAAAYVFVVPSGSDRITVQALFPTARGVYVGDDVTVLGVPVGTITKIRPTTDAVRVTMEIDGDEPIAATAWAAQVASSVISVRAIEIGPRYTEGPRLSDGDTIPLSRTNVPVEWDEVKRQLVRLTDALGPDSESEDPGALSDVVDAGAQFLEGQGGNINQTLTDVSEALATLADNRGDLFATVRNLQVFTAALRGSDAQVRSFNRRLASVADYLDDDSADLRKAIRGLVTAFRDVRSFVRDNRELTVKSVRRLERVTSVLGDNPQQLADLLQVAPGTLSNLYGILDPRVPAPTGILSLNNLRDPANFVCSALQSVGGTEQDCRTALGPLLRYFSLAAPPLGLAPGPDGGTGGLVEPPRPTDRSDGQTPAKPAEQSESDVLGIPLDGDLLTQLGQLLGGRK